MNGNKKEEGGVGRLGSNERTSASIRGDPNIFIVPVVRKTTLQKTKEVPLIHPIIDTSLQYMICVDGSTYGDTAFERAKELYVADKDMLVVVLVLSDDESKRQGEREVIQRYAKQCVRQYNSKMITEPLVGSSVGACLLQTAKDEKVDAIIIGRRGMSSVQRFFTGSVSRYIMENADCDVLVVKAKSEPTQDEKPKQLNVEF